MSLFQLPNDMGNYMRYKLQGSVKLIRMKKGCLPSKFDIFKKCSEELVEQALKEHMEKELSEVTIAGN